MFEFCVFFIPLQKIQIKMNKTISPQTYREELKYKIVDVAMLEFKNKGIKAVKMDDIANDLSISKRTLYEIFENKEVLLLEVVKASREKQREHMSKFAQTVGGNVMEIIFELYNANAEASKDVNPLFYEELKKYKKVTDYILEQEISDEAYVQDFFMSGIEQGYFLERLNYKVISKIMRLSTRHVIIEEDLAKFEKSFIFKNVIFVFLRGICTAKGIEAVNKLEAKIAKIS